MKMYKAAVLSGNPHLPSGRQVPASHNPIAAISLRLTRCRRRLLQNPLPWPERVCNAVWASAEADMEDRAAAIKLGYGDYQDLSPAERMRVSEPVFVGGFAECVGKWSCNSG